MWPQGAGFPLGPAILVAVGTCMSQPPKSRAKYASEISSNPVTSVTGVKISLLIAFPPCIERGGGCHATQHLAVAVGATAIDTAVAPSPLEQIKSTTNRYEPPASETDFRIGDHQQLRNIFFDRDRLR